MTYVRGESKNVIVGAAALFVNKNGPIPYLGKEGEGSRKGVSDSAYVQANKLPDPVAGISYKDTLSCPLPGQTNVYSEDGGACEGAVDNLITEDPIEDPRDNPFRNVGYTSDGIEISFEPDFGEIEVDQVLDAVKLFKQGIKVTLKTVFAEATLENLLIAIAGYDEDLWELDGENNQASGANPAEPEGGRPDNLESTWTDSLASLDLSSGELGECPVERGLVAVGPGPGVCGDTEERIYVAYRALSIDNVTVSIKRDEESKFETTFRLLPDDGNGSYGKIVDRDWRGSDDTTV
jgi:hypothetical protein